MFGQKRGLRLSQPYDQILIPRSIKGACTKANIFRCNSYGYSRCCIECRRRLSDKRLDNMGSFNISCSILVTDVMNRSFGASNARKVVYGGFLVGVIFSIWLADIRIALASGTAFLTAQLIDIFVFNKVSQKTWWQAPFISSSLSSAIDTVLFFSIAFIGSGLPWVTWAAGDYAIKLAMAILLLVPFKLVISIITNQATVVPRDTTP